MKPNRLNRERIYIPLIFIFLFLIAAVTSILLTSAQRPKPADAPEELFSAERAFKHIEFVGQWPNMSGSAENEIVCNYIAKELETLGLEVDIQATSIIDYDGIPLLANITNVLGRIRGTNNTKAILVVGHYDTQPHTPGAADDGIAVASMLEAARVLEENYSLENDIIFLFTDAEEVGLIGAEAFAQKHPWRHEVGLVVNLEARGNKGPVLAFEVSPNNGWIMREFAKGVDRPFAASMMYEVYNMLPNNTDFTIFKNEGYSGFNLALIEGFVNYHSATDTPENLSLASLQHMGSYIVSIANHFGNLPLYETKDNDLVYFNILGHYMVLYPSNWNVWILSITLILFVLFVFLAIGRQYLSFKQIPISLAIVPATLIVIVLAIWGANWLILKIYPHYGVFYSNNFYNVEYYFVAYTAIAFAIFAFAYLFILKKVSIHSIMISVYFLLLILSVALIWMVPTAAYLTLIPLGLGLLTFNILLILNIEKHLNPTAYHLLHFIGNLPFILIISPVIKLLFVAFGLDLPFASAGLLAILLLLTLPFTEDIYSKLRSSAGVVSLVVAAVFLVIAHTESSPTNERPLQSHAIYASLNQQGEAYWLSSNLKTDSWNSQFFKEGTVGNASKFYPWRQAAMLKSNAEFKEYDAPSIEIMEKSNEKGNSVVEFVLTTQENPTIIDIIIPYSFGITSISFNNEEALVQEGGRHQRLGSYLFRVINPSHNGDKFRIEYNSNEPLDIRTIEKFLGIPKFDHIKPMPPHIIPSTGFESYISVVLNEHTL